MFTAMTTGAVWAIGIAIALLAAGVLATRAYMSAVHRRHPRRGRFVDVGGARAHVVHRGEGPPVVAIHGMYATLENFPDALLDVIARSRTVVAIDRPGHGSSGRVPGTRSGLDENVALVRRAVRALGLGPVIVVGHSYGTCVALRWALEAPDEVRGILGVAPLGYAHEFAGSFERQPLEARPLAPFVAHTVAVPAGFLIARHMRHEAWHPQTAPPRGGPSRAWALMPEALLASAAELHRMRQDLDTLAARYADVRVPVALIAARGDRIAPPALHAERLARDVPGATLEIVEDVGHQMQVVRPERVVAALERLERRISAAD